MLDEGPTAAVAPDDLESRAYRECSPAAPGRISEISERQTRAPDIRRGPCAAANDARTSARRGALAWSLQSVQSQSPTRRGHAFELVNVSKAHPTDRDRRHRSDRCKL